jgi:hypothetical protein
MKRYGYVEVHGSGFPLKTSDPFTDRGEAVSAVNGAYHKAVNTGCAAGIRFGVMDDKLRVKGRLVITRSWRKYGVRGPFK